MNIRYPIYEGVYRILTLHAAKLTLIITATIAIPINLNVLILINKLS